jgi:hypothetical protein
MNDYNGLNAESKVLYNGRNPKNQKRLHGCVGRVVSRAPSNMLVAEFNVLNKKTGEYDTHTIMTDAWSFAPVRE